MLPPMISNYINNSAEQKCRDTGHVCPHWINHEINDILCDYDDANDTHFSKSYQKQCHEIEIIYRPYIKDKETSFKLRCRPLDHNFTCDYQNLLVENEIYQSLKGVEENNAKINS